MPRSGQIPAISKISRYLEEISEGKRNRRKREGAEL